MPRPTSTKPPLQAKAARQARYRQRLRDAGRPEASMVDIAIAAATSAVFNILAEEAKRGITLTSSDSFRMILKNAKAALVAHGHSESEAHAKLLSRIRRRHSVTL